MDIQSQSKERAKYFKSRTHSELVYLLFETFEQKENIPYRIPEENRLFVEELANNFVQILGDIFDKIVEPYDNDIRATCLKLSVESVSSTRDYHSPESIVARAKYFETYIYGTTSTETETTSTESEEVDFNPKNIYVKSTDEGLQLISRLRSILEENHFVTVNDLLFLVHLPTTKEHTKFGWTDVSEFGFIPQEGGSFLVVTPKVKKLPTLN